MIKQEHILLEDCLSTDNSECRIKGRFTNYRGQEDPQKIYCGGISFVDHASGVVKIHHQVSLEVSDNARSKEIHELWAAEDGISVKSYRRGTGVFNFTLFDKN